MKKILTDKEARNTILEGLKILHDPVASTLGPCGRNVLIETGGISYITKDGATVARYIEQLESDSNQGIRLLKMVSQKMAKDVGDGTTTATILAYSLLEELMKILDKHGKKLVLSDLEDNLKKYKDELINAVSEHTTPCTTAREVEKVARVSTNGDNNMASNVMTAFSELDSEACVILEEHNKEKDEITLSKGFQWDKGYMSQRFMTDPSTARADLHNPIIFMTTDVLQHPSSIYPLLRLAGGLDPDTGKEVPGREQRPILIVARDVKNLALAMLIDNHIKQSIKVPICAVECPGNLDTLTKYLEDLRAVVGGKVFYDHETAKLRKIKLEELGTADKVLVEHNKTTILKEGSTESVSVLNRVSALKLEKESAPDSETKDFLKARIAKLMGSMVHIKVGASSKVELMERKDRYEDAIYAVRSALKNGYIPGGGVVPNLLTSKFSANTNTEEGIAKYCLYTALKGVTERLYMNSGREKDLKDLNKKIYYGYNLAKKEKELVSMVEEGIIEPADILISSLEQAVSLAVTVLRTNTLILYDRKTINNG